MPLAKQVSREKVEGDESAKVANQNKNLQTATVSRATQQTRSCAVMMKIKLMANFKKRAHPMSPLPRLLAGLAPLRVRASTP